MLECDTDAHQVKADAKACELGRRQRQEQGGVHRWDYTRMQIAGDGPRLALA